MGLLLGYLGELDALVGRAGPGPAGNVPRRAVERLVQLVVEVTIDVNGMLAARAGLGPPASARDSFDLAVRAGALPAGVAEPFKTSFVALRNRIVHDYDRLDEILVLRASRRLVVGARAYAAEVRGRLAGGPTGPTEVREPRPRYRTSAGPRPAGAGSKKRGAAASRARGGAGARKR